MGRDPYPDSWTQAHSIGLSDRNDSANANLHPASNKRQPPTGRKEDPLLLTSTTRTATDPLPPTHCDPSPTPRPKKKKSPVTLGSNQEGDRPAQLSLPEPTLTSEQPDAAALTATVLTKILTRLEALERLSMPPPVRHTETQHRPNSAPTVPREETNPRSNAGEDSHATQTSEREEEGNFTLVARNGRSRKGKGKLTPPQINLTPASYASAAAASASTKQPTVPHKPAQLPAVTEVTVLRAGSEGHSDPQVELSIRARAADAIVREVRLKMANTVPNPIPLRAGRWSIQARSKGNFVYSFDGNIPFDLIRTYERILLTPFHGTGKLSPSMGWTRLLAHGVPVFNEGNWTASGPEALLKEAKSMPGLKKAHFAMPPRWLKPVGRIETNYSMITFAISDPDGSITSTLLNGRAALFGKEVTIQRWVNKPALVQCSHCHELGHIKTSRACSLGKDSVRCYICGGSHHSDAHNQKCPRKHTIAGICDCRHFKCLNCHNTGHHCRNTLCPARDMFRPWTSRKGKKHRNEGKANDWAPEAGPSATIETIETIANPPTEDPFDMEDLYAVALPPPTPPNWTNRQVRTERHHEGIDRICARLDYDPDDFPEAWNCSEPMDTDHATARSMEYSPSRPQGDAYSTTNTTTA
jgi:hypothetical protein